MSMPLVRRCVEHGDHECRIEVLESMFLTWFDVDNIARRDWSNVSFNVDRSGSGSDMIDFLHLVSVHVIRILRSEAHDINAHILRPEHLLLVRIALYIHPRYIVSFHINIRMDQDIKNYVLGGDATPRRIEKSALRTRTILYTKRLNV